MIGFKLRHDNWKVNNKEGRYIRYSNDYMDTVYTKYKITAPLTLRGDYQAARL